MRQSLPGIYKVAYINCDLLPADIALRALSGTPIGIYTQPTPIDIVGESTCEVETTFDNNSQIEKATLTFHTTETLPTHRPIAFLIKTVQGDTYIIGSKEPPYPTIKIICLTGSPSGDAAVRKYEVSFTARKSLALCAV